MSHILPDFYTRNVLEAWQTYAFTRSYDAWKALLLEIRSALEESDVDSWKGYRSHAPEDVRWEASEVLEQMLVDWRRQEPLNDVRALKKRIENGLRERINAKIDGEEEDPDYRKWLDAHKRNLEGSPALIEILELLWEYFGYNRDRLEAYLKTSYYERGVIPWLMEKLYAEREASSDSLHGATSQLLSRLRRRSTGMAQPEGDEEGIPVPFVDEVQHWIDQAMKLEEGHVLLIQVDPSQVEASHAALVRLYDGLCKRAKGKRVAKWSEYDRARNEHILDADYLVVCEESWEVIQQVNPKARLVVFSSATLPLRAEDATIRITECPVPDDDTEETEEEEYDADSRLLEEADLRPALWAVATAAALRVYLPRRVLRRVRGVQLKHLQTLERTRYLLHTDDTLIPDRRLAAWFRTLHLQERQAGLRSLLEALASFEEDIQCRNMALTLVSRTHRISGLLNDACLDALEPMWEEGYSDEPAPGTDDALAPIQRFSFSHLYPGEVATWARVLRDRGSAARALSLVEAAINRFAPDARLKLARAEVLTWLDPDAALDAFEELGSWLDKRGRDVALGTTDAGYPAREHDVQEANFRLYAARSAWAQRKGNPNAALQWAERASEYNTSNRSDAARLREASLAFEIGHIGKTREALSYLRYAANPYARHLRARLNAFDGRFDVTYELLKQLRQSPAARVIAAHSLAALDRKRGYYERARDLLEAAREAEPENAFVLHELGNLASAHGNFKEAEEHYKEALRLDPHNVRILVSAVAAHLRDVARDPRNCVLKLGRSRMDTLGRTAPGMPYVQHLKGHLLEIEGHTEEARAQYEMLGENAAALTSLAQMGEQNAYERLITKATHKDESVAVLDRIRWLVTAAELALEKDDRETAEALIGQAEALDPDHQIVKQVAERIRAAGAAAAARR